MVVEVVELVTVRISLDPVELVELEISEELPPEVPLGCVVDERYENWSSELELVEI